MKQNENSILFFIKELFIRLYFRFIKKSNVAYARYLGVKIGNNCQILDNPKRVFGTEPWLIKLGDHVEITSGVRFVNHEGAIWCLRGFDDRFNEFDYFEPIIVGNNVLLGLDSLIMPGVKIGNNVIVAAHSVVTKDIPDDTVVAGLPAKPISKIGDFVEKFKKRELFPTKNMTAIQKKEYLQNNKAEWFK